MTELTREDLQVGALYRGKRRRKNALGDYDDRIIIWMSMGGYEVQYDSYFVGNGRQYPKTTAEAFLKWAKERVTET